MIAAVVDTGIGDGDTQVIAHGDRADDLAVSGYAVGPAQR